jgi:hypothetical protein
MTGKTNCKICQCRERMCCALFTLMSHGFQKGGQPEYKITLRTVSDM